MMKLHFSPFACSMATRIVAYEGALDVDFLEVDPKTKRTSDDQDFRAIHPLGLVPALRLDDGTILTENAAILQLLGRRCGLVPDASDALATARLQQWLSFVGTELHKAVYIPLLTPNAPDGAKAFAREKADARLSFVAKRLETHEHLLDRFAVADAYLFTVLNWSRYAQVDLSPWPAITAYVARLAERPSVARALADEAPLLARHMQRHGVAPRPTTRAVIDRFNDVFQRHDPSALDAIVADECVIENTRPTPDGARLAGKEACVASWRAIALDPEISFDLEEVATNDEHAIIRWRMRRAGSALRGVNLMRVRDGRIVEARGYVKGA